MPQILRNADDTLTLTVSASDARFPTAVALPRGVGDVLISPTTNVGRFAWDVSEGADATVASTFPVSAGAALTLPVPPVSQDRQRHIVTIKIDTALADAETLTFSDGTNTIILEADPSSNGVDGGSTEIGTNASTAATQAAGIAAALIAWGSGAYVRAEVDAESTSTVVLMAHTAAKTITITGGTATSSTSSGDAVVTVRDVGTGIATITDYGKSRPIVYVLSATTSTAISLATVGA